MDNTNNSSQYEHHNRYGKESLRRRKEKKKVFKRRNWLMLYVCQIKTETVDEEHVSSENVPTFCF